MVTELMDADLSNAIPKLSYEEKLRVAKEVANGMCYLHECGLLHRDLKPGNILLSKDGRCKITDFGLTRQKPEQTATLTTNIGTFLYTAPEVFTHGHYDEKADVYSYGMLVAQMMMDGIHPLAHVKYQWSFEFVKLLTEHKISPQLPTKCSPELTTLIQNCISWEAASRPTFIEIQKSVEKMKSKFHSLE